MHPTIIGKPRSAIAKVSGPAEDTIKSLLQGERKLIRKDSISKKNPTWRPQLLNETWHVLEQGLPFPDDSVTSENLPRDRERASLSKSNTPVTIKTTPRGV